MNESFFAKYRFFFYIAFLIIAIVFSTPLFLSGFGSADDFQAYLIVRLNKIWTDIVEISEFGGRFYYLLIRWLYYVPYLVDDMFFTKWFQVIPILGSFIVFAWLIFEVTRSKPLAWFTVLIFLTASQASTHTSLFFNYPILYSLSFSMLIISVVLMLKYYEHRNKAAFAGAVVLFAAGLLFYETYLLFLLFILLVIADHNLRTETGWGRRLKKATIQFLPFLIVALLYLAVYLLYRHYHPSQYPGTQLLSGKASVVNFFKVLWNLSVSSFPLTVYESNHWLFESKSELVGGYSSVLLKLFLNAKAAWLIKGLLVMICGYLLLTMMNGIKTRTFLTGAGVAILLIFIPHIPLAISEKYIYYVVETNMQGYVTTYFSLFGTMMFITYFIAWIMNLLKFNRFVKHTLATVFAFGFFICSVITDFTNHAIAMDFRSSNLRLYAVREYLKSDAYKSIPPDAVMYIKDWHETPSYYLKGLTEQGFHWSLYFIAMNGYSQHVVRDEKEFLDLAKKDSRPMYYATLLQAEKSEDVMLAVAKLEPVGATDSVINTIVNRVDVTYYSPYKIFTLNFKCQGPVASDSIPLRINHIHDKCLPVAGVEMNVYNTKRQNPATIFTLEVPSIDLKSLMISNMNNWGRKWYYL